MSKRDEIMEGIKRHILKSMPNVAETMLRQNLQLIEKELMYLRENTYMSTATLKQIADLEQMREDHIVRLAQLRLGVEDV